MPSVMPITDFRKSLFDVADWILRTNQPVDVQKNGQTIFRAIPIFEDTPSQRAEYIIKNVLPKLGGSWKDMSDSDYVKFNEQMRGKKAIAYNKKLRNAW